MLFSQSRTILNHFIVRLFIIVRLFTLFSGFFTLLSGFLLYFPAFYFIFRLFYFIFRLFYFIVRLFTLLSAFYFIVRHLLYCPPLLKKNHPTGFRPFNSEKAWICWLLSILVAIFAELIVEGHPKLSIVLLWEKADS